MHSPKILFAVNIILFRVKNEGKKLLFTEAFMKKEILAALAILLATLIASIIPTDAEAMIYEDTLRLHILANSDSEQDQLLKIGVRDAILKKYSSMLEGSESIEQSKQILDGLIYSIETDAEEYIRSQGYCYGVRASLGEEWYDTRDYGELTLPEGRYASLRIVIGEGVGENWWCVMYPPLCLDIATEHAPKDDALINYSGEEISLISGGKYNVKFKILELLSSAFTKKS